MYKKIINDFINPRKLTLKKIGRRFPLQVQALLKEIGQRLGMSKKDAFEVYRDYVGGDDVDLTSPKVSTGPKCELKKKNGRFRLTITNLRDYTRKKLDKLPLQAHHDVLREIYRTLRRKHRGCVL